MKKGTGLNSIPIRFALMSAMVTSIIVLTAVFGFSENFKHDMPILWLAIGYILIPTLAMYLGAWKLTQQITALKNSTEAIAEGNFDKPIDVNCDCELGGLADSFRGMVGRINTNIVRMNVLAFTDPLTKLANRSVISHMLNETDKADQNPPCSVLFMEVDGIKQINDTYGHQVGDIFLLKASHRIIEDGLCRQIDQLDMCLNSFGEPCHRPPQDIVIARYAGDEFVVIIPKETDSLELSMIAERIIGAFTLPFECEGHTINTGISIGISKFPMDTDDPKELIKYSDIAMHASKRNKDRNFAFFKKEMHEEIEYLSRLEADLKSAINNDEILLHYQPKVHVNSGKILGVEALARWKHPIRGMISPAEFIFLAEETGLIIPLGRKIIELALQQSEEWVQHGKLRKVAINIASSQFESEGFIEDILGLMKQYNAPENLIELEITESMAMSSFDDTKVKLELLQKAGLTIAIDDFGTGFSNLSQLSRLPFDTLKIDRSLISDIGREPKNEAILRAVIKMSAALGFNTVAEGIETEEQYRFLDQVDCDIVQGFLLGKPMEPSDLDIWELKYSHPKTVNQLKQVM